MPSFSLPLPEDTHLKDCGFSAALDTALAIQETNPEFQRDFLVFAVINPSTAESAESGYYAVVQGVTFGPFDYRQELLDCIDRWDFSL